MSFLPGFFPGAAAVMTITVEVDEMAVLLDSGTVSNAATLDIVLTSYTGYRALIFRLDSFVPATDDVALYMQMSTNGGASYDATTYRWVMVRTGDPDSSVGRSSSSSDTKIDLSAAAASSVSNDASEGGLDMNIYLADPEATRFPSVIFNGSYFSATNGLYTFSGSGCRAVAQNTDAVRFMFESGNIASGKYAVYGML